MSPQAEPMVTADEPHEEAAADVIHFLVCPTHNLASRVLGESAGNIQLECGHTPAIDALQSPIFAARDGDLPDEAIAPVDPDAQTVAVPVDKAAAAADELPPDATWPDVAEKAKAKDK